MSSKTIPEHIDPFRYAEQGIGLSGTVKLADLQRLSAEQGDIATVDLQFGVDEQGLPNLRGHLETKLTLQCQRCMEPLIYEIISNFALGIVNTLDEADSLPEHYEPAIAKEGALALRELIEDEIMLNLPIIPRHAPEDCHVKLPLTDAGWEEHKGKNPFHVLASLKEKDKHR